MTKFDNLVSLLMEAEQLDQLDQLELFNTLIEPGIMSQLEKDLYEITPQFDVTRLIYDPNAQIEHPQYGSVYKLQGLSIRLTLYIDHISDEIRKLAWHEKWPLKSIVAMDKEMKLGKKYYTWEDSI